MAKKNTTRVTFLCNNELLEQIESYCEKMHITRSTFISIACSEKCMQEQFIKNLPSIMDQMQQTANLLRAQELSQVTFDEEE